MGLEQPLRLGVHDQRHPEGIGDRSRGDVVMRRADPAGREDIIETGPHLVDRRYDHADVIGDHPRFAQPDADRGQPPGEEGEIGVRRTPGQDLVTDNQDTGGDDFGIGIAGRDPLLRLVRAPRGVHFIGKSMGRHNCRRHRFEDCRTVSECLP
jgi:hypothetical protein